MGRTITVEETNFEISPGAIVRLRAREGLRLALKSARWRVGACDEANASVVDVSDGEQRTFPVAELERVSGGRLVTRQKQVEVEEIEIKIGLLTDPYWKLQELADSLGKSRGEAVEFLLDLYGDGEEGLDEEGLDEEGLDEEDLDEEEDAAA